MSSHDLSFIHKRDDVSISDIPAGGIAGIAIGIVLIVLVSIWCCCPCWKKQKPILSRDDTYKEDVGHERGVVMGSLDSQKTENTMTTGYTKTDPAGTVPIVSPMSTGDPSGYGIGSNPSDRSTTISALSMNSPTLAHQNNMSSQPSSPDNSARGVPEVDGRSHGGRINELDGAPGLYEAANTPSSIVMSPPPRYEQIPRRAVAPPPPAELPAVPASTLQQPEKR